MKAMLSLTVILHFFAKNIVVENSSENVSRYKFI
jgi:hypothetical protein